MPGTKKQAEQIFENIKHDTKKNGVFWYARDLQEKLGYDNWSNFTKIIYKAQDQMIDKKIDPAKHITKTNKKITVNRKEQKIDDMFLSYTACYFIVHAADQRKTAVLTAQEYFIKKGIDSTKSSIVIKEIIIIKECGCTCDCDCATKKPAKAKVTKTVATKKAVPVKKVVAKKESKPKPAEEKKVAVKKETKKVVKAEPKKTAKKATPVKKIAVVAEKKAAVAKKAVTPKKVAVKKVATKKPAVKETPIVKPLVATKAKTAPKKATTTPKVAKVPTPAVKSEPIKTAVASKPNAITVQDTPKKTICEVCKINHKRNKQLKDLDKYLKTHMD